MNSIPCATLVLKTSDLTAGSTTNVGSMNALLTDMTWNNIDLRILLGDMYDKHDRFNLCLKGIASSVSSTGGSSQDDQILVIRLSGLPFVNETYSQSKNVNLTPIILTSFKIQTVGTVAINLDNSNGKLFTFAKHQEVCNIRIYYTRTVTDGALVTPGAYPTFIFIFEIYGL